MSGVFGCALQAVCIFSPDLPTEAKLEIQSVFSIIRIVVVCHSLSCPRQFLICCASLLLVLVPLHSYLVSFMVTHLQLNAFCFVFFCSFIYSFLHSLPQSQSNINSCILNSTRFHTCVFIPLHIFQNVFPNFLSSSVYGKVALQLIFLFLFFKSPTFIRSACCSSDTELSLSWCVTGCSRDKAAVDAPWAETSL